MTLLHGIPLAGWADRQLATLARATGAARLAEIDGATLLGERAMLNGYVVPGRVSAGGGCRLFAARDRWVALNLARPDDRHLLPALFGDADFDGTSDDAIAARIARSEGLPLVALGRELGLATAATSEPPPGPAWRLATQGPARPAEPPRPPLVVDLSALWAGPLAGHLLWLAGAEVVKLESVARPDAMRHGDPALFDLLNQGKASVAIDFRTDALRQILTRADIVIEAARPRALRQLGIDAGELVRDVAGLVWISITGHGADGDAANWVGFGDDCGVAGGLAAALEAVSGAPGFVGDAIADPLTGILAARLAWERYRSGVGGHVVLSMSGTVAEAIQAEREWDSKALDNSLKQWSLANGTPFPPVTRRTADAARPFGADTAAWLAC